MRLTTTMIILGIMQVTAASFGQKVTISAKNESLSKVFRKISQQTGHGFILSNNMIKSSKPVSLNIRNVELTEALQLIFQGQPLTYILEDKIVTVKLKTVPSFFENIIPGFRTIDVRGKILDENAKPLAGATIAVKGKNRSVKTDPEGAFFLSGVDENDKLIISFVGYQNLEVNVAAQMGNLKMKLSQKELEEVKINTGMFERKKESFTGATAVYSGAELKTVGNKNVLESLRSLDPSFVRVENNLQGSNPNRHPNFEVRGQTTINTSSLNDQFNGDPNQPLFILDGFETTLQLIYDLDMNRVASLTILKDAASTALYGAKAANGVVVVETKRPVPGKLQISYTTDLSLNLPDLSSYNLMNAAEKLEYERLQGLYSSSGQYQAVNEATYNAHLQEVKRGVDTYWLSEPVRTGVSQRHSLWMQGGNTELSFGASVNYGTVGGVMKGSDRNTWGAAVNLGYRKGRLNVTNILNITGTNSDESPYGSFSSFANAIPYYRKRLEDGIIPQFLDEKYNPNYSPVRNPLYDASLNSINNDKQFKFFNNTQAIWSISNVLRMQAAVQVSKGNANQTVFTPPDHSKFFASPLTEKGSYVNSHRETFGYNSNLMLTYAEVIGKHQITANVRGDMQESNNTMLGFSAAGFPYGTNGNPIYAFGYTPFSRPSSTVGKARSLGFLASTNYTYDQRYMLDLTYRLDGASAFGTDHLFKPFASAGLGWNLHKESFINRLGWINLLKLRGTIGVTGNENLGQFSSVSTYNFQTGNNNGFGQGLTLASLGNPSLDWQRTRQASYGLDFSFLKSRISGYAEYFEKKTDPLAVSAVGTLPSSAGIGSNYVMNVGTLTTKGWNFNFRISPVYLPQQRIVWTVGIMGNRYNSVYGGFADKLAKLNELQQNSKGLLRFYDGYSPDDIWAVVSRGVDPATGQELYQKKDGSLTFSYNTGDIVKVGNTRPLTEGGINTSFTYKDFTFNCVMRYRIGGYVFNSALYNKVENTNNPGARVNYDKRALYDRWRQPGDVAQFTSISATASQMSSRFVQKDNHLIGESISLSYRANASWIKKLGLQSLSVNMYLNDIFMMETIQTERGIEYPYSRTTSLSLNASF